MRSAWVFFVPFLILASSAKTLAAPLVVDQGFFETTQFVQTGTFSGDNFAVSGINTPGGNFSASGTLIAGFGHFPVAQVFPAAVGHTFNSTGGTIQVGSASCPLGGFSPPDCGGAMMFISPPLSFNADLPFTMTGRLVVENLIVDIEGHGIVHATSVNMGQTTTAHYAFVAEPSTVALLLSGLVAVGWSRWRGGKRSSPSSLHLSW